MEVFCMKTDRRHGAAGRTNAARFFGYDLFISFALGPPPRGTRSYSSDLARRLRERDYTVFFSEDEAPPGEQLDKTLIAALRHSKTLVVIANRDTIENPRWVRKEVEEFTKFHPSRPIIPISVGGAIQDPALADQTRLWLRLEDKERIWLDESQDAAEQGVVSDAVLERLATAPTRYRSNVRWRWLVRAVAATLTVLSIALGISAKVANDARKRAEAARARAEDLVQFMLFDLGDKLKPIGRLDLMDSVNEKVKDYYASLGADGSRRETVAIDSGRRETASASPKSGNAPGGPNWVAAQVVMDFDHAASLVSEGDTLLAEGKVAEARKAYGQSFEIAYRLVDSDRNNAEWAGELGIINDRLGDVAKITGALDTAQKAYEEGLKLRLIMTKVKSPKDKWQRELWVSYTKLGQVLRARGQLDASRERIQQGLAVAEKRADPKSTATQLDLAATYEELGETEMQARHFEAAHGAFEKGLNIRQAAAATEPRNALTQRDMAMSYRELGDVAVAAGDADAAHQAFEKSIFILKQLTSVDPRNRGWQHDVGALYQKLGDLELDAGHLPIAATFFEASLDITRTLTEADPNNDDWQSDKAVTIERFGVLSEQLGSPEQALMYYEAGQMITEGLLKRHPDHAEWKSDLEWVNRKIAKLKQ
jgi:tetratricopeptide (TPR) repeat protein